ncbi:MAG: hypothetical protein OHK0032_15940 [Thermodesulfovibrionales bacterium]
MVNIESLRSGRRLAFQLVVFLLLVFLMANLGAMVDSFAHPDIPYFDEEHLIVGFFTGLVTAILLAIAMIYLNKREKVFQELKMSYEEIERTQERLVELQKKTSMLTSVIEQAAESIVITDLTGNIIYVNPFFEDVTGYSASEALGKNPRILKSGYQDRAFYKELWDTITSGNPWRGTFVNKRKDGSLYHEDAVIFPIKDSSGKIANYAAVKRDITDRKKAESALKESEERFRLLTESTLTGVYLIQDNLFRYVNPALASIFGYRVEDLIDKLGPMDLVAPEDRALVAGNIRRRIEGEVRDIRYSFKGLRKDGAIIDVEVHGAKGDYNGRPAVIGTLLDITERNKLEEQFRQAQKMEAIGLLAGGIAHDFNNILNAIIGFGSLIEMNMKKDDPSKSHIREILNSGERAAHLTRSLLAFSRKQIIEPKPQNLNEIIRGVEKFLKRIIGEDIELKTVLLDKDLIVFVDRGQIEQVLMNLATNARDAMPDGGELIIETEIIQMDEEYIKRHGYGKLGTYALLSVTDTGIGMDEKTRERIFEPFFTTKELGRGTGLGLAMVYGIVKQHDGFINVYSEPQKGTIFKIFLSLLESEVEDIGSATPPAAYPEGGVETVLVAEDDQTVRKLTRDILERFGYKVIASEDGEDAIKKFKDNKEDIQLLLLDVIMPKKNGKEVYEEIKKLNPDIKTIFLSGYTANLIHKKGILEEGLDFILKPVSPKELLRKVREILDK